MTKPCERTGLTRADVIVIAVVCLLLIILVPVLLALPREQAMRRVCAANLAQIGKAMLLYGDDHAGALPRAGGPGTVWGTVPNWMAPSRHMAFALAADGSGGTASINASFYLLVKYVQLSPRVFVCKGDRGATEFKLADPLPVPTNFKLSDAWDFGPSAESFKHCSYAYHIPYGLYSLNTSLDPKSPVAADRNPWIKSPAADPAVFADFKPDIAWGGMLGTSAMACRGNSITHRLDGQNVLFLDGRVTFEKRAYCGLDKDNIYTLSRYTDKGDSYGVQPVYSPAFSPMNRRDSLLVHDPDVFGYGRRR